MMFTSLFLVLLLDALLVGLLILALVPVAVYRKAAFAVMKRNFISYFTTPTGYVFLCLFVLLSSFAAFWPHSFFASNMATLAQLNFYMPAILLLFIPAITMSVWAEERRQGTDELLLTIPADDFDIVLGKYLAAGSIFTASLLFSQLANFSVLNYVALGGVDLGLFFTTYIGYWFMGMAMLAIGMVASFLTGNVTVAFILGVVFNAPLALAHFADVIVSDVAAAQSISAWSMAAQFEDFGRGVISLRSVAYFTMVAVIGIYLSMVLIGRRHWLGGKDGHSMLGHYLVRTVALVLIAISATAFLNNYNLIRQDFSSARINTLSPETRQLIRGLKFDKPVRIEAFISRSLPDSYVRPKYELLNLLKELRSLGGDKIKVAINDRMEPFSDDAKRAKDRYNITPQRVPGRTQGIYLDDRVFMGVAFACGSERVVAPFIGPGTPVEYELVHSIVNVVDAQRPSEKRPVVTPVKNEVAADKTDAAKNNPKDKEKTADAAKADDKKAKKGRRKKIGILGTDAQLLGGPDFTTGGQRPEQPIVTELRKQYEVVSLTPGDPVTKDDVDVLLVAQPSSLTQQQLDALLTAIRAGVPTALFEDPFPAQFNGRPNMRGPTAYVPGTDFPKRSPMAMFGQPPQEKCDIKPLWELLGVHLVKAKRGEVQMGESNERRDVKKGSIELKVKWELMTPSIWQDYNPYPADPNLRNSIVMFATTAAPGGQETFNAQEPAVSGLHELAFIAPAGFQEAKDKSAQAKGLKFTPLVSTGTATALRSPQPLAPPGMKAADGQSDVKTDDEWISPGELNLVREDDRVDTGEKYVLAARITGRLDGKAEPAEKSSDKNAPKDESQKDSAKAGAQGKEDDANRVNVLLVGDIDVLDSVFVDLRARPNEALPYQFQNVTFVLNLIDSLAGEDRFYSLRKRTTYHAPLKMIEDRVREAMNRKEAEFNTYKKNQREERQAAVTAAQKLVQDAYGKIELESKQGTLTQQRKEELEQKAGWKLEQIMQQHDDRKQLQEEQLASREEEIQDDLRRERQEIQNSYKAWAAILPPIPPLLIGLAVYLRRRLREGEGVSQARKR
jgi:ABC-2 type transport system permease protein